MNEEDDVTILIVPGLHGSGNAHWQSWLEAALPRARRVEQRDWARPSLPEWSARLCDAIADSETPVVLVGHSFGCLTIAHALTGLDALSHAGGAGKGCAALLVAPANPARFDLDPGTFLQPLPCTSVTVGSQDDPWMAFDQVRTLAQAWGSSLVNLGHAGHVNVASGFGAWPLGLELTQMLCRQAVSAPARTAPERLWSQAA